MTVRLLKLFVPNYQDSASPQVRTAVGKLSGVLGILANLLLFAGKLAAGLLSGALSVVADAMNNLSDAVSSIVTFVGFKLAEKPADADHPYGHARYEYLSGLAVAAMIIVIGFELMTTSFEKILNPAPVDVSPLTVGILIGSIAVKLLLSRINGNLSRRIRSAALAATAADSRNDCVATFAVLIAAVTEKLTSWQIDGFVGLGVALFILYSGAMLAKETISPLLGEAADPELREQIAGSVSESPYVLGYHDLMVHDYGPGQRFASLHVEMDQRVDPVLCHEIIDDLERDCLKRHGVHLVIHYDPVVTDDPDLNRLRSRVEALLAREDPRLCIHDFRMVPGTGHTNLVFDVTIPTELESRRRELQAMLEDTLSAEEETAIYTVITFDPASFN